MDLYATLNGECGSKRMVDGFGLLLHFMSGVPHARSHAGAGSLKTLRRQAPYSNSLSFAPLRFGVSPFPLLHISVHQCSSVVGMIPLGSGGGGYDRGK